MNKKNSKIAVKTAKSVRLQTKKPVQTVKKPVISVKKSAKTSGKAVQTGRKPAQSGKKALQTSKKVVQTAKKPIQTSRKPVQTGKKPVQTSRKPRPEASQPVVSAALELPEKPHERWRPEYLGNPYVLSNYIPNYMPTNEADLMDWLHNFVNIALTYVDTFPDVFGSEAPFPRAAVASLRSHIVTMRLATREAEELARSWRAFKNIALYATEHKLEDPLTSPVITTSLTTPYS